MGHGRWVYVTLADEAAAPGVLEARIESMVEGSRALDGIQRPPRALIRTVTDVMQQAKVYADLGFDVADVDLTGLQAAAAGVEAAVLVFPHALVPVQELITRLYLVDGRRPGIFDRNFEDPDRYRPVADGVPRDRPYLIHGFEPGVEYLNVAPREAMPQVLARGRFPMTIEEGLAVFASDPACLQRNKCFSLAGSTRGDKRVPALWISNHAPKLGWCFAGAPHTWLGLGSIAGRMTDQPADVT